MPTDHSNPRSYPNDPPVRGLALVITCVDFRLLDDLVCYLDHENLTNRYYHLALGGAGLAFGDVACSPVKPNTSHPDYSPSGIDPAGWRKLLLDHLVVTLKLTKGKLTDVLIVEHRDCGAFRTELGLEFPDDRIGQVQEEEMHRHFGFGLADTLLKLLRDIKADKKLSEIHEYAKKVKPPRVYLMDLRGNVERLN